jgi:hypothetical protein
MFCPFVFQALSTEIARPYYFLFSNFIKPEVTANSKGLSGSGIRVDSTGDMQNDPPSELA